MRPTMGLGDLRWLLLAALLMACTEDKDSDPEVEAEPDVAVTEIDAATVLDEGVAPDEGVQGDARIEVDGALIDRCEPACTRVTDCSIDECEGNTGDDRPAIAAACAAACGENQAFATIVLGAGSCETVVEFAIDNLGDVVGEGCEEENPIVPGDPALCPWECQGDEICSDGHCVRPNGTCETDYHCRFATEQCVAGECEAAQFAECRNNDECRDDIHSCRNFSQDPLAPGNCYIDCVDDSECPNSESCRADLNICYYEFCGPGSPAGVVYAGCVISGEPGTCYPLPEGNSANGETAGVCLEGGSSPIGGPCDSQAVERNDADRALRCEPGGVCFGDADDPREPGAELDNVGECVALCDPRAPECDPGFVCVDYSNRDDPATPGFDDTRHLGVCQRSDCDVLDPEQGCEAGLACRALGVLQTAGNCGVEGAAGIGEVCETADDCAGNTFCGNNGIEEQVCIELCAPGSDDDCSAGSVCFVQEPRWVVGFCVPTGEPVPDGGIEPDMGLEDAGVDGAPDVGQEADAGTVDGNVEGDSAADAGLADSEADAAADNDAAEDNDAAADNDAGVP